MSSIRRADVLYRPALIIMGLSVALQVLCLFAKIFA